MKKTFIIIPMNKETGSQAPGIAVSIEGISDAKTAYSYALREAQLRSRLSAFPNKWYFI
jgi:hypothetical protein